MNKKLEPTTKIERHVARWLKSHAKDSYDGNLKTCYNDLMYGGCASGMVGHLIYYTDTVKFFKRYQKDINDMLRCELDNSGLSIKELFGDKWDDTDPLALDQYNQNLLAWFGFEESARVLAIRAELEE